MRLANLADAVDEADTLVLLVDHQEFKSFDLAGAGAEDLRVVDTRGIW